MKRVKKGLAAALAVCMAALLPATPALGAEETPAKEEVVYINLLPDGTADTVDVVNIFDVTEPCTITDRGAYASVRNMTTTDPVTLDGEKVTVQAQPGRLYYEGRLLTARIPWDISIRYYLAGVERPAEEIAGASGRLGIRLTVEKNERCPGTFFEDYALQATITLNGDMCRDISAPGATVANVGADKQLNFTFLPGQGADVTVTAQVEDFSMDAIAINGVPLALDVEVDDSQLMDQVDELLEAIAALDDGAGQLQDGADQLQTQAGSSLQDGADSLSDGAGQLRTGAGQLQDGAGSVNTGAGQVSAGAAEVDAGVKELSGGIGELAEGLTALDSRSQELLDGSAQVLNGIHTLQTLAGGSLDTSGLDSALAALSALGGQVDALSGQLSVMADGLGAVQTAADGYADAAGALDGAIGALESDEAITETDAKAGHVAALRAAKDGLNDWYSGLSGALGALSGLQTQAQTLLGQLADAKQSIEDLSAAVQSIKNGGGGIYMVRYGLGVLASGYLELDDGIRAYTGSVAQAAAGAGALVDGADALAQGSGALAAGASDLYAGTSDLLGGVKDIYAATGTLRDGAGRLDGGVAALLEALEALQTGAGEMKDGTGQLRDGTDGMDAAIQEKIDELLDSVSGSQERPVSFVSAANGQVDAVQFVMRAPAVEKPAAPAPAEEPAPAESFWDRLTDLFR